MAQTIDQLIINSPYKKPEEYWHYEREIQQFVRLDGRRPAGYVIATPGSQSFDDPGVFREIELANQIRDRVERWQKDGRPGMTGISRRLFEHWTDESRDHKFFFCQIEAIETLIFLQEAPESYKVGVDIPSDGGPFERLCSKMATGSGKTVVMAMIAAWNIINKTTYRQDTRFSKNILAVAPGLTVKSRLSVLQPSAEDNYYDKFDIVPADMKQKMYEGKIKIINWHMLMPLKEQERSVVKIGAESNEAFTRRVLEDMADARNIVVMNDEAHHAWRLRPGETESDYGKRDKLAAKDATRWMEGLDRISKTRGIVRCFDLSATPFRPMGDKSDDELLFGWIVSDFGLNDAIESGLVKTPRVVVRSDSMNIDVKTMKPKLYHIYNNDEVKYQLGKELETEPLPDLVRNAYYLLAKDWQATKEAWEAAGHIIPPVMISVVNRTETAARIEHSFRAKRFEVEDLNDPNKILRIDSKVLGAAEEKATSDTEIFAGKKKDDYRIHLEKIIADNDSLSVAEKERLLSLKSEELLREVVDSVGAARMAGEQIQHVIAVAMLSEGWDTKNVTHVMGLRAFSSQLLCEQVVGRGLRRVNYEINEETGLFDPEYVNIFGVPFSFIPSEDTDGGTPLPPSPQTRVEVNPSHPQHEITWPNVQRVEYVRKVQFNTTVDGIDALEIDGSKVDTTAELAATLDGKAAGNMSKIDLQEIAERYRPQHVVFRASSEIVDKLSGQWEGKSKLELLPKVISLTESFMNSGKIHFTSLLDQEPIRKKVLLMMNMNTIVQHIADAILFGSESIESTELVFDKENVIRSTADMPTWYTKRESEPVSKSQISHMVADGGWEMAVSRKLDSDDGIGKYVESWVKNDHLGFEIPYMWGGKTRQYIPDFIIKLTNGKTMVLEVKGVDTPQNQRKRKFLDEWIKAVNTDGRFGEWCWGVMFNPSELDNVILEHIS